MTAYCIWIYCNLFRNAHFTLTLDDDIYLWPLCAFLDYGYMYQPNYVGWSFNSRTDFFV